MEYSNCEVIAMQSYNKLFLDIAIYAYTDQYTIIPSTGVFLFWHYELHCHPGPQTRLALKHLQQHAWHPFLHPQLCIRNATALCVFSMFSVESYSMGTFPSCSCHPNHSIGNSVSLFK